MQTSFLPMCVLLMALLAVAPASDPQLHADEAGESTVALLAESSEHVPVRLAEKAKHAKKVAKTKAATRTAGPVKKSALQTAAAEQQVPVPQRAHGKAAARPISKQAALKQVKKTTALKQVKATKKPGAPKKAALQTVHVAIKATKKAGAPKKSALQTVATKATKKAGAPKKAALQKVAIKATKKAGAPKKVAFQTVATKAAKKAGAPKKAALQTVASKVTATRKVATKARRVATKVVTKAAAKRAASTKVATKGRRTAAKVATKGAAAIKATKKAATKAPRKAGALAVHKKPDRASPKVAVLLQGDVFYAKSQHRAPDGQLWLSLADGSGFVLKSGASKIRDQGHDASLIGTGSVRNAAGESHVKHVQPSTDEIKKVLDKIVAYGEKKDLQLQHMEGTSMSINGLPQKSRHFDDLTYAADWRAEYPTAAPASAIEAAPARNAGSMQAITLPILVSLATLAQYVLTSGVA